MISIMTQREIILANLNHDGPPRHGITFSGDRINDINAAGIGDPEGYTQKRWVEGTREYYDDVWGNIWVRMTGGSKKGEVHKPAITDWSQLDDYQPPVYDRELCARRLQAGFGEDHNRFRLAAIGGWIFDNARYVRRLDIYLMDMALHPEEIRRLHRIVCDVYETKILAAADAGADGIMIGEDMGTQTGLLFSPAMWRDYFKAEYTRLFSIAHDRGMKVLMHSCGQNTEIVPDLLEAGVDCFQFDQPEVYDMPWLADQLKTHTAALWSPVDIQTILPTGDKETIVAGTERMIDTFDGYLICKDYPDLHGIGVEPEWDDWFYRTVLRRAGLPESLSGPEVRPVAASADGNPR